MIADILHFFLPPSVFLPSLFLLSALLLPSAQTPLFSFPYPLFLFLCARSTALQPFVFSEIRIPPLCSHSFLFATYLPSHHPHTLCTGPSPVRRISPVFSWQTASKDQTTILYRMNRYGSCSAAVVSQLGIPWHTTLISGTDCIKRISSDAQTRPRTAVKASVDKSYKSATKKETIERRSSPIDISKDISKCVPAF